MDIQPIPLFVRGGEVVEVARVRGTFDPSTGEWRLVARVKTPGEGVELNLFGTADQLADLADQILRKAAAEHAWACVDPQCSSCGHGVLEAS